MIGFTRVLCPIDFSETSTRALVHAAALAGWYEAQLHVLHVVPVLRRAGSEDHGPAADDCRTSPRPTREEALAEVSRAVDAVSSRAPHVSAIAEEGREHEVVVTVAQALPADLLVMGTHGRSGFHRLFLGSITEKVIRTAPCPVLTVPPAAAPASTPEVAFKRILCPIDFSPSSLRALEYALELARQANGRVTMLNVLEYMEPEDPCEHVDLAIRTSRQSFIDRAREHLRELASVESTTWCDLEGTVLADHRAYNAVLRTAASAGADLIVMGAQGTAGVELTLYGSNTHHVVRAAHCPVLTVRA